MNVFHTRTLSGLSEIFKLIVCTNNNRNQVSYDHRSYALNNSSNNNNNNNNNALGVVRKRLDAWLEKLGVTIRTGLLQKTALLGTARILRKLLDS